ncbi:hypothetical protein XENORESO_003379, partial [Xenotaenia resolanae]
KMTSLTLKSVEEEEQKQVFMAFARVYSGMVKKGQRVFVLGPKYDPTQGLSLVNHSSLKLYTTWFTSVCLSEKEIKGMI